MFSLSDKFIPDYNSGMNKYDVFLACPMSESADNGRELASAATFQIMSARFAPNVNRIYDPTACAKKQLTCTCVENVTRYRKKRDNGELSPCGPRCILCPKCSAPLALADYRHEMIVHSIEAWGCDRFWMCDGYLGSADCMLFLAAFIASHPLHEFWFRDSEPDCPSTCGVISLPGKKNEAPYAVCLTAARNADQLKVSLQNERENVPTD